LSSPFTPVANGITSQKSTATTPPSIALFKLDRDQPLRDDLVIARRGVFGALRSEFNKVVTCICRLFIFYLSTPCYLSIYASLGCVCKRIPLAKRAASSIHYRFRLPHLYPARA